MAVVQVAIGDLDTWLSNQPANTVDTPYEIEITGITTSNYTDIKTALQHNSSMSTKYVDLSPTSLPSGITDLQEFMRGVRNLVYSPSIPETVTSMNLAFADCTSLKVTPVLPSGLTDAYHIFYYCTALTTVTNIPASLRGLSETFQKCSSLVNVCDIPSGITSLYYTFDECTSLVTAPSIPDTVTTMEHTFVNCTSLVNAPIIPNGVTLMNSTFSNCTLLTHKPIIPSTVTTSTNCYRYVTSPNWKGTQSQAENFLSTFFAQTTDSELQIYNDDRVTLEDTIFNVDISTLSTYLAGLTPNTVSTAYKIYIRGLISSNVSDIKTALQQNSTKYVNLSYTILPDSISCTDLFRGCSSLIKSPVLPSNATSLNYTFYGCENLAECPVIPSSITSLNYTFNVCRAITTPPVIPSGVTSMTRTFGSCSKLVSTPQIPQGVTSLRMTFIYCSSLETVGSFPSNLTSLEMTFSGCSNLSNIPAIPEGVTNMEEAFAETGLTTVPYVPSTVTNGIRAFAYCESLAKIDEFKIPLSVLDSSNFQNMFQGCSSLVQIGHKPAMSDSWHVMSLNIGSNTVSGKIYDSEGNDTEINEGTAVSITKDTLSLPNLTDEILFPPSGLSDADLEDTILDVIENKYTYWKKIALDPTKKSFVMYADDPDNFVTNIEMGGSTVKVYDTIQQAEADLPNLSVGTIVGTEQGGDGVIDAVLSGDLRAVTSNAVAGIMSTRTILFNSNITTTDVNYTLDNNYSLSDYTYLEVIVYDSSYMSGSISVSIGLFRSPKGVIVPCAYGGNLSTIVLQYVSETQIKMRTATSAMNGVLIYGYKTNSITQDNINNRGLENFGDSNNRKGDEPIEEPKEDKE